MNCLDAIAFATAACVGWVVGHSLYQHRRQRRRFARMARAASMSHTHKQHT